jgi:hypothetical protein
VSRLHPRHRAGRHDGVDIKFAANKGWQNHRPRGELGVWKFFQIKAARFPLLCIPAVRAAFVLVRRGFTISGESRQKHRIINEADPHRRSDHRDENPEANREKSCKQLAHRRYWTATSVRVPSQGVYSKHDIGRGKARKCDREWPRPVRAQCPHLQNRSIGDAFGPAWTENRVPMPGRNLGSRGSDWRKKR